MSYELTGKLIAKADTVQRTATFKTREFVIEKTEDIGGRMITNYAKFQCVQDKTSMPDRFTIGETVKVYFNIKGSKWERNGQVNYITNLGEWKPSTSSSRNRLPRRMITARAKSRLLMPAMTCPFNRHLLYT